MKNYYLKKHKTEKKLNNWTNKKYGHDRPGKELDLDGTQFMNPSTQDYGLWKPRPCSPAFPVTGNFLFIFSVSKSAML